MSCLIITGFQRTGTTVLGEWLGLSANVRHWGEIFHPDGLEPTQRAESLRLRAAANYFRFREQALSREQLCAVQTMQSRNTEWDAYLEALERLQPGDVHVLSVKYSSWHHLNLAWQNPSEPPYLLALAIARGYPVLHCRRRNLLALGVSEWLALATDVWHAPTDPEASLPPVSPVAVDADFVLRRLRACAAEAKLFRRWLRPARSSEIWYEDLFGIDGGDQLRAVEGVKCWLPDWRVECEPPLKKLGRDPRAWIANIEEFRSRLLASEFATLAQSWL